MEAEGSPNIGEFLIPKLVYGQSITGKVSLDPLASVSSELKFFAFTCFQIWQ
jgi:hypothetical protein